MSCDHINCSPVFNCVYETKVLQQMNSVCASQLKGKKKKMLVLAGRSPGQTLQPASHFTTVKFD